MPKTKPKLEPNVSEATKSVYWTLGHDDAAPEDTMRSGMFRYHLCNDAALRTEIAAGGAAGATPDTD